jgi:hypothetical protein
LRSTVATDLERLLAAVAAVTDMEPLRLTFRAPQVPELPGDLAVAVARAAMDGRVLAKMLQVCRAWRTALTADRNLWREAALAKFPRLKSLVSCPIPRELNFRELYRNQARAEKPQRVVELPPLSDYILTAELGAYLAQVPGRYDLPFGGVPASNDPMFAQYVEDLSKYVVLAQSSSPLLTCFDGGENLSYDGVMHLTKEPAYDELIRPEVLVPNALYPGYAPTFMRLKFFVTRVSDMSTVKIWEGAKIDGYEWVRNVGALMEYSMHYVEEFCEQVPRLFPDVNCGSDPAMRARFTPSDGMRLNFGFLECQKLEDAGEVTDFELTREMSVEEE